MTGEIWHHQKRYRLEIIADSDLAQCGATPKLEKMLEKGQRVLTSCIDTGVV